MPIEQDTENTNMQKRTPGDEETRTHFLELPGELRNQIYELVYPEAPSKLDFTLVGKYEAEPALTKVSRRVREESLPYLRAAKEPLKSTTSFIKLTAQELGSGDYERKLEDMHRHLPRRVLFLPMLELHLHGPPASSAANNAAAAVLVFNITVRAPIPSIFETDDAITLALADHHQHASSSSSFHPQAAHSGAFTTLTEQQRNASDLLTKRFKSTYSSWNPGFRGVVSGRVDVVKCVRLLRDVLCCSVKHGGLVEILEEW
jgi:hypothetical protein